MTTKQIAERVEGTVRLGDALGKTETEIHADVHEIVGHLPLSDIAAVHQHIAASVADNR